MEKFIGLLVIDSQTITEKDLTMKESLFLHLLMRELMSLSMKLDACFLTFPVDTLKSHQKTMHNLAFNRKTSTFSITLRTILGK